MEDLKEGFGFQKAGLAKFVSWNNSWEVALGMQFHAVHQQQLWPPDQTSLFPIYKYTICVKLGSSTAPAFCSP